MLLHTIRILKNIIFIYFSICFLFNFIFFVNESAYAQPVLKGGIRTFIEKGRTLEVNLGTPINFYYSQAGDKVAGYIREDILIGDDLYIPAGSRVDGIITEVKKPKHFGQDGSFEIDFNEIVTPDGTAIPVYASVSTDTSNVAEKASSILSYDAALVAYGTFHGLVAGFQYGGLPLAITSHGISLLAGAGIGASAGVIGSIVREGKVPTVLSGVNTDVLLKSNLYIFGELPNIKEIKNKKQETEQYKGFRFFPPVNKDEIELVINEIKKNHSGVYGDYIVLKFNLKNNSQKTINLSDVVLLSETESGPLHADLFLSGTEALKSVKPSSEINASLAFILLNKNKISDYSLVVIDPLDRKEIVKMPLKE
ncbi:MAG: hypothetical protein HY094_05225 [Candidatus Melainabacteria bacterium]|nr:hypothetical protein [Candidatus Melainabacteria bacterium]